MSLDDNRISGDGFKPAKTKIEAVLNLPTPTDATGIRSCPISKSPENKDLARTRHPVRPQACRPTREIGDVL